MAHKIKRGSGRIDDFLEETGMSPFYAVLLLFGLAIMGLSTIDYFQEIKKEIHYFGTMLVYLSLAGLTLEFVMLCFSFDDED